MDFPVQLKPSVRGKVLHRIFHNAENGYTVLSVHADRLGDIEVVCSTPMPPSKGEVIIAEGAWVTYKGKQQLKASAVRTEVDRTDAGVISWLKSQNIRGVGETTRKRLGIIFRGRLHDVVDNADSLTAGGIARSKAELIAQAWSRNRGRAEFISRMMGFGFTAKQVVAVEEIFGESAVNVAETNPWEFCREVDGIGFLTCDRIAERAGLDMTCDERVLAGLGWVLHDNLVHNGHCGVPREYLEFHASRLLKVPRDIINRVCNEFIDGRNIVSDETAGLVYGRVLLEAEQKVAARLLNLRDRSTGACGAAEAEEALLAAETEMGLTLDRAGGQFRAALAALTEPVLVITGGPGTGKSTIQKVVVNALEKLGKTVSLAAPTGRAAKRLSETSGRDAGTIHRLLEFDHTSGDFKRQETRPLGTNVTIIDEFSMVDVRLASCLLSAVRMGTAFIMVGDFDQLPSVGPGQVLRDIIESDSIPVSRLTVVRRQVAGSGIALAAGRVREGLAPWEGDEEPAADFRVIEREDEDITATILRMLRSSTEEGFRAISDIQVLAAMKKGETGVEALNIQIKDLVNPVITDDNRSIRMGTRWFTVNDRVMQIRNDYKKGVHNGEVGSVVAVGKGIGDNTAKQWVKADYGGVETVYDMEDIDDMVLAYAATVHKSQGCEFPSVIVACASAHRRMLSRNLLYTAMTRARTRCSLVGARETIRRAAATEDTFRRFTALKQRLKEYDNA